jgi:tRNA (cytidine32/uridine32-2'-O)-methyltransferase
VQVLAYETRMQLLGAQPAADAEPGSANRPPAMSRWRASSPSSATLDEIDFHKGRAPESAMRKLRRLFLRSEPSEQEVRLLRGILADTQRMARLAQAGSKDS